MVDPAADSLQFFLDAQIQRIAEIKMVRRLAETDNLFSQCLAALAAFCPNLGQGNIDAKFIAPGFHQVEFGFGIRREGVDGHHAWKPEDIADVPDMLQQIGKTLLEGVEIFLVQVTLRHTAVILQRADRGDNDDGVRTETGHAAFDIEEFFRTKVGGEAGFRDHIIRQFQSCAGSGDRVAAVGNVGKGSAVNKSGSPL